VLAQEVAGGGVHVRVLWDGREFSLFAKRSENCRGMSVDGLLLDGAELDSLASPSEWKALGLPKFPESLKWECTHL
jgi:hypothetical protein